MVCSEFHHRDAETQRGKEFNSKGSKGSKKVIQWVDGIGCSRGLNESG